eukprot:TRINITY_DN9404_c0_g1_i7.p1 TRINITY_DN9404_c0_g1~~TRINITY_DN9404_c0_g1_i7.p1  ORF type:complete len:557 (-),score=52.58 TRINITY_DN9404_c0_g1_i7:651-2321(-)
MISEGASSANTKTLTIGSPERSSHPNLTIKIPADPPLTIPLIHSENVSSNNTENNHSSSDDLGSNNHMSNSESQGQGAPVPRPANKVTLTDFQIITVLGRGSYGEVMMVRKVDTGQQFAMKIIDKNFLSKEKKQYQVYVEREVLTKLRHPNVIKLYYSFQDRHKLYFVVELMDGGEFSDYLRVHRKLEKDQIRFYAAEITNILEYLHSKGIAHRDLKPGNLMLNRDGHLKVIDFGTARFFLSESGNELFKNLIKNQQNNQRRDSGEYDYEHKQTFVGTAEYVSPEMLNDEDTGKEADLWALGCIIFEMFVGETPFRDDNEYLTFQRIKNLDYKLPQNMPDDMKSLVSSLLKRDPRERLGAGERGTANDYAALKRHPFFAGIDFENIHNERAPINEIPSPYRQRGPAHDELDFEYSHLRAEQDADVNNSRFSTKLIKTDDSEADAGEGEMRRITSLIQPSKKKYSILLSDMVNKAQWKWMGVFSIYRPRKLVLTDMPRLLYFEPQTNELLVRKFYRLQIETNLVYRVRQSLAHTQERLLTIIHGSVFKHPIARTTLK